jgi:hypothetical protein
MVHAAAEPFVHRKGRVIRLIGHDAELAPQALPPVRRALTPTRSSLAASR